MYWPIECIPKPSFVEVFEFVRITNMYWPIECNPKPSFIKVFEFAKITYI